MKKILIALSFILGLASAQAKVILPYVFSNGMVLQQQTAAPIWGTDKPNVKVTIKASWGKQATTTTARYKTPTNNTTNSPTHPPTQSLDISNA